MSDPFARLAGALADRYRFERQLGAGGMASVFLAEDLKHHRRVAVKVLRPELAASLGAERFLREIETTAGLRHPHILPLYDSGEAAGLLYYVMPLVEGESLADRLQRDRQLPVEEALRIALEVADALQYAHGRHVVHRDIKPGNILLEGGHAVVADFGIARAVSAAGGTRLTDTGIAVGTPAYMSPEQAAGERDVDGRSDVYALACVLFEMLAGQPPFTGATAEVVVRQHLTVDAPPVTQHRPAVPAVVATALQRALAKNPADRFPSVSEFAAVLRAATSGVVATRPVRAAWRRGAALAGATLLLAALWFAARGRGRPAAGAPAEPPRSIAVLPFRNLRGDSAGDYFTDGVTEEILHALTQLPELRVAARTSAFRFRDADPDVREVGAQLGVAAVLQGSIQREGDAIRITTQLVDVRSGYQLWSGKFDRRVADLFAIEDEISRAIADTLKVSLGLAPRAGGATPSVVAHDLYLRGLALLAQRGAALRQSVADFERAIAADSTFAPAWAGLAMAQELLPAFYLATYPEVLPGAERAARRAIALDSTFGPAYTVLGSIHRDRMEWAAADSAYGRALALAPNDPEAAEQYGQLLFWSGQPEKAIGWMARARRLDPLAPIPATTLGVARLFRRQYDSAEASLRLATDLGPGLALPEMWHLWNALAARRYDVAARSGRRLAELSGVEPAVYDTLVHGVADPRLRAAALRVLARTPDDAPWALDDDYRPNWLVLLGDTTGALDAVEHLARHPSLNGILALWTPVLDPIRDHPRFRATLRRFRLPFDGGRHA